MPLGEIKPRILSDEESRRLMYLASLGYPEHKETIRHLSQVDFRAWLYILNPRDALIMSTSPEGRGVVKYQNSKRWYQVIRDWAWRKVHGDY